MSETEDGKDNGGEGIEDDDSSSPEAVENQSISSDDLNDLR